jgi:enoyl-CoA hydratase/carnithine racemase
MAIIVNSSDIVVEELANDPTVAVIKLNAPKRLNALTYQVARDLTAIFKSLEINKDINLILIESNCEKSFCAGGNLKGLYNSIINLDSGGLEEITEFFTLENELNERIFNFSKPIIAYANGYTFGGGFGFYNSCRYKIVGANATFSMPEITIGFFPDVGAGWYLNKLPYYLTAYIGLTGIRLNASDALALDFADFFLDATDWEELKLRLGKNKFKGKANIPTLFLNNDKFNHQVKESKILSKIDLIGDIFKRESMTDILYGCEKYLSSKSAINTLKLKWFNDSLNSFMMGSPFSRQLSLKHLRQSRSRSRSDCLKIDTKLAILMTQTGEFQEGIRAKLIDKDETPNWCHKSEEYINSILEEATQLPQE